MNQGKSQIMAKLLEEISGEIVPIYSDERGQVRDFGCISVEGLHVVEMKPGSVRGNHVHDRDEIMCITGGSGICKIDIEDETTHKKESIVVEGDMKAYRIKAGIRHIVRNIGNKTFYLVCFCEKSQRVLSVK